MEYLVLFLEHSAPIIATIVGAVILRILSKVSNKYEGKVDIETRQRTEALTTDIIHEAVARAEQWAKNRETNGRSKLNKAVEYIATEIRRNNLPRLAEDTIVNKIEATLGFATVRENHGETIAIPVVQEDDDDEETDIYPTNE